MNINESFNDFSGKDVTYSALKEYLITLSNGINFIKDYLVPYATIINEPVLINVEKSEGSGRSRAYPLENKITLYNKYEMFHEYVHIITPTTEPWMSEGLAELVSYQVDIQKRFILEAIQNGMEENLDKEIENVLGRYDQTKDIQQTKADDEIIKIINCIAYIELFKHMDVSVEVINSTNQHPNSDNISYVQAASLLNYMMGTYGEEKIFAVYQDYLKFEAIVGKSFHEVKEEWMIYLESICAPVNDK